MVKTFNEQKYNVHNNEKISHDVLLNQRRMVTLSWRLESHIQVPKLMNNTCLNLMSNF